MGVPVARIWSACVGEGDERLGEPLTAAVSGRAAEALDGGPDVSDTPAHCATVGGGYARGDGREKTPLKMMSLYKKRMHAEKTPQGLDRVWERAVFSSRL